MGSGSCDNRCTSGKEGTCTCSCGGVNHGTAGKAVDSISAGQRVYVKGTGINFYVEADHNDNIAVYATKTGSQIQKYANKDEACKEIGELVRGGKVEVTATDLETGKSKVLFEPKLTQVPINTRTNLPYHLQYHPEDIERWSQVSGRDGKVVGLIITDASAVAITKDKGGYGTVAHQLPHEALPVYESYSNDRDARAASFAVRERIAADFKRANPKAKVKVITPDESVRDEVDAFERKYKRRNEYRTDEKTGRTKLYHPKYD